MKTVCKENMCVGCMACLETCNKNAITIQDTTKEYNAVIDENLCINCGACHRVCQNNNSSLFLKSLCWFQGWCEDKREYSSSGGVAAGLIDDFIKKGGTVCSCAFKGGTFGFYFSPDELTSKEYAGSKYVKSSPKGVYRRVRKILSENRKLLFLGLPCQVEAVKQFVGGKYQENLYTVDLICHGSPSPKLLDLFLTDYGLSLKQLETITFRNKTKFGLNPNVKELEPSRVMDMYTFSFLKGLDYTENCYHCKYARPERVSDITLGDSWGSNLTNEQTKGISLILCQSEKGEQLVKEANLQLQKVDYENAVANNHQLRHPSIMPKGRERFFDMVNKGKAFKQAVAICYPQFYVKQVVKRILIKMKIISGGVTDKGICFALRQDGRNLPD